MTQALDCVREAARRRKKGQFTGLLHHIDADTLRTAFYALKRKAAPGVDGTAWHDYEADLEPRIDDLHGRVHRGAYRPQPSRRTYIPKADGKQRPLAIAALEDKIVQGATVMALTRVAIVDANSLAFRKRHRKRNAPVLRGPAGVVVPSARITLRSRMAAAPHRPRRAWECQ